GGIERLAGGENHAHGDAFAAEEDEIRQQAEDGGKGLEDFSLVLAEEADIGGCGGFRQVEDAEQDLALGQIVSPERRVAALRWNDAGAEESEARLAGRGAGPGPLAEEETPIVADQLLGVGHAEVGARGSRGASADAAVRRDAEGEQAFR